MTVVYMNTDDIYQLFINFKVPGVRKEVARLAQGVNTGAAGDGTVQAIVLKPIAQKPDQETVDIDGAPEKITERFCFAHNMAVQQPPFSGEAMQQPIADEDMTGFKTTIMRFLYKDAIMRITYASIPVLCVAKMLKLDTEKIVVLDTETHQYNANILVNKIIDGPEELKGLWDVSKCVKACAPAKYSQSQTVTRAIKNITNNNKYPSRTSLRMEYDGVILVNVCMSTTWYSYKICTSN